MNRLKKILGYGVCFSIFWSNIAWAGKEFIDQQEDSPKPLVSIKPHTFSSSRDIDSVHFFESGEIVAEDVQGTRTLIPNYQQPKELKEAIQGGYVDALLKNLNLYIRGSGDDLKIELMGGLKGGMKPSGQGQKGKGFFGEGYAKDGTPQFTITKLYPYSCTQATTSSKARL